MGLKYNPITGSLDEVGDVVGIQSRANLMDLIDSDALANTTVSPSFATLLSSPVTLFKGTPVLFLLSATARLQSGNDTEHEWAIQIDGGADVVIASRFINPTGAQANVVGFVILTPTAGNHTINLRWRRALGTGTVEVNGNDRVQVKAIEL